MNKTQLRERVVEQPVEKSTGGLGLEAAARELMARTDLDYRYALNQIIEDLAHTEIVVKWRRERIGQS
jgi:hypothetical protein